MHTHPACQVSFAPCDQTGCGTGRSGILPPLAAPCGRAGEVRIEYRTTRATVPATKNAAEAPADASLATQLRALEHTYAICVDYAGFQVRQLAPPHIRKAVETLETDSFTTLLAPPQNVLDT